MSPTLWGLVALLATMMPWSNHLCILSIRELADFDICLVWSFTYVRTFVFVSEFVLLFSQSAVGSYTLRLCKAHITGWDTGHSHCRRLWECGDPTLLCRKWRRCMAFLARQVVLRIQEMSCTLYSCSVDVMRLVASAWALRKSPILPVDILTGKLLPPHLSVGWFTFSLYAVSSLMLMKPTTVVSSAYLTKWFGLEDSWVSSVHMSGVSVESSGVLWFSVVVLILTDRSGSSSRGRHGICCWVRSYEILLVG